MPAAALRRPFSWLSRPFAENLLNPLVMGEKPLNDRGRIIEELGRAGHERLVGYATQQIHQFRGRKDFAVQYADSEKLPELEEEMLGKILDWVPAERRVRGLSPEELAAALSEEDFLAKILEWVPAERRMRGLSPEKLAAALSDEEDFLAKILEWVPAERRVRGLSPEQLAAALSDEEAARLREVLERKQAR